MEKERIEQQAKNILREVLVKLHNKDYERVEEVVDELKMGMKGLLDIMGCVEEMMDPEDSIDELSADEDINFFETFNEADYRINYMLKSYGDKLGVYMDLDFIVTETGIKSVLRTIDI